MEQNLTTAFQNKPEKSHKPRNFSVHFKKYLTVQPYYVILDKPLDHVREDTPH